MPTRKVLFILFDGCEVLDAAGPLQAFHEANDQGCAYEMVLHDPSLTLEAIAYRSGLGGDRQLRRAWHAAFGHSPMHERRASSPRM